MIILRTLRNKAIPSTTLNGCTALNGFTLVELLVTLLIASIVAVTVPPLFIKSVSGTEVRSTAHRLSTALRTTRNIAITQKQDATLTLDIERRTYRIPGSPKIFQLDKDVSLVFTTAESETIDSNQGNIRFFPDGSSTGGQIKIAGEKSTFVLDIDWLTGKINLHE